MGSFGRLVSIALRSLVSHRIKSAIVGFIVFFGTFLVVVGTSLLDSIEASMAESIVSSLAGHLQVYAADARDELALFGGGFMGADDVGEIEDFSRVKEVLLAVPNVEAVVPMGLGIATITSGNEFDRVLAALRSAVQQGDEARIAALREKIEQMAHFMREEYENRRTISRNVEAIDGALRDLDRVGTAAFWEDFSRDPERGLLFLDTRIAPLSANGNLRYLRYLGTDLARFATTFDRFKIVAGKMVPPGRRGFLFSKKYYEDQVKHKVARELDRIRIAIEEKGKRIADDPALQARVRQLPRQYRRITLQLDPRDAQVVAEALRAHLGVAERDLTRLVEAFLRLDDANFAERYAFFYDVIAPRIRLYDIGIGDILTLHALTRSGYMKAVNVEVYGVFTFEGLDRSDLAGATNLIDIVTFRELYGAMTQKARAELRGIREAVGVREVDREEAEAALFGTEEGGIVEEAPSATGFDEFAEADFSDSRNRTAGMLETVYTQEEIDQGLALNAAVLLEDPDRLAETKEAIEAAFRANALPLQVVDWQKASGIVGQFIVVIRLVLYTAIVIIFLVALVIINNAMVMATMERVGEIGTMRAIGAQREFILAMFLLETLMLGFIAGSAGAVFGALFIAFLGSVGVPATTDILVFLFSGPRLFPTFGIGNLLFAFVVILIVSVVSTLYPAWIATRIEPIEAIEDREQG